MVTVKICGITTQKDLAAAVDAEVDLVGFVVKAAASPRNLSLTQAKKLIAKVPRKVGSVAVTVFKTIDELQQILSELKPDYLQLHGDYCFALDTISDMSKKCVIAAVDGKASTALDLAVQFSNMFQFVLVDTAGVEGLGGTGITNDWIYSRKIRETLYPRPLILAGGLTPTNVEDAIRVVKPFGVDVSSGVEQKPGIKDHKKIREFVLRARGVQL